ncbi:hypothetical protein AAFF_G00132380 [Aldrovandia affinis]|uniref:carbonyl reductase (NADPH) n=1 Tax=Aldrovandia affinis TaxID=143900 RepID=A0AAD7RQJ2_9TELE|nr:hypothetical protein AAFF_G00132380 [Aldrovandia affinis]
MSTPKVALVTGSNKGIGLAVVRSLCAQFRGDVYLSARSVERGTAAVQSLRAEGLNPLFHQLDISDPASVTCARDFFTEKYGGLDVLVNNAGIAFKMADTTPFAIQAKVTLKTNFFATRDLCNEFLPIIKAGGRVVNVSSVMSSIALKRCGSELQARFRSDDITEEELVALMERFVRETQSGEHAQSGWPNTAYGVSKIGVTVLSRIQARRLRRDRPGDGILLNACCPGWVRTDMAGPSATKSPDEGAVTPVYLALLPAGASEPHGQFVSEEQVQEWKCSRTVRNQLNCELTVYNQQCYRVSAKANLPPKQDVFTVEPGPAAEHAGSAGSAVNAMDPEEQELLNDYRYRGYSAVIEKALRNFESSSEWADLISSLGKLNKALQSNLKYSLLPKRLIICKRLAQCLHPALPTGVHLKALETYEIIFKIIGTKWLAKDLFIYSSGLFPLLSHAAMSVKPALLTLYERYYLPLQRALLPSLQAFVTGLLPGLEEGLEVYDRYAGRRGQEEGLEVYDRYAGRRGQEEGLEVYDRTDALLVKLSLLVGQQVFFSALWGSMLISPLVRLPASLFIVTHFDRKSSGRDQSHMLGTDALLVKLSLLVGQQVFFSALWGSMLISPLVRLPASLFIVTHFDRKSSGRDQSHMLGSDYQMVVKSVCLSLQDSNVLVQRNTLEILLYFFPFCTCLDPAEGSIPMTRDDMISIVSAASLTLLRRDMSLNRRLYAWILGTDIKGDMLAPDPTLSVTLEDHSAFYFQRYSRDLLIQALISILQQRGEETASESLVAYLRPFRIILSLLDKPEIGPQITEDLMLEVVRAFYRYCREMLGQEADLSSSFTGNQAASRIKGNKNASEIIKTVNMLISAMNSEYLWDHMSRSFQTALSARTSRDLGAKDTSVPPSVTELSALILFLLDVIPLELYPEIQPQYLPQMLAGMLRALRSHMTLLSLSELTQGLRACFKVLSKIQMPAAYMDMEAELQTRDLAQGGPVQEGEDIDEQVVEEGAREEEEEEEEEEEGQEAVMLNEEAERGAPLPPLRSEDSGLGLSASPSEQQLLLAGRGGAGRAGAGPGVSQEKDGVWRKGGSVEEMNRVVQDILAAFITRYLLHPLEGGQTQEDGGQCDPPAAPGGRKGGRELGQITMPQFKEKLTEFFTPGRQRPQHRVGDSSPFSPGAGPRGGGPLGPGWGAGYLPRDRGDISEACRQAFTAACHLLLECTTFPVYLSEHEMAALHSNMFHSTGNGADTLPLWLRSLMVLCCLSKDHHVQHTAISSLLELVNHSQSLALVIEDKNRRYKSSDHNPFSGRLQMVTVPPIYPGVLKAVEDGTDFYQRVAQVLWAQLDSERREHHISCVELFYRLHCLAPSTSICEDIICLSLLHTDKAVRLEALHRFSVLWHLTREIQANRTMSLNRSFDRSLFVVLDSLNSQDGSISAAGQSWLVRALSLSDVVRILEPVLLLLLHPKTHRSSILSVKQNLSVGNLKLLTCRPGDAMATDSLSQEGLLDRVTIVDREALWAEVEHAPEAAVPRGGAEEDEEEEEEARRREEEEREEEEEEEEEDSEHTESADTSGARLSTENSSSGSTPYLQRPDLPPPALQRSDSQRTQASGSLSSDEDEAELEALARSRLLRQEQERQEAIDSLFRHALLYAQPYDSTRVLYAFSVLDTLLRSSGSPFVRALCSTGVDTSSTAHLNLICNLLQRHREALEGRSFYGRLQTQSPAACPHALLVELLACLCLRFLRSHYPCYLSLAPRDLLGNRDVQVKSVEEYVLLALSASMHVSQRQAGAGDARWGGPWGGEGPPGDPAGLPDEQLIHRGRGGGAWSEHPLQMELLKLLQVLVVLEQQVWGGAPRRAPEDPGPPPGPPGGPSPLAREWQTAVMFQQSIRALQYVPTQPIAAQGMFVSAVARALQPRYGYALHGPWVALLCASLPYLGRSLAVTVAPFVAQICKNLDELVRQHDHESSRTSQSWSPRRENIAPDYPLTLLEGLTTITHYCLLDNKKSAVAPDPVDMRNARNAIVEELPRALNTMALLWGAVRREDTQKKSTDSAPSGGRNTATSVYFKSSKILRQKILDFLNPLTAQFGVQVMASVGAVWNSRKSRRSHSKNKILPVASESRLTIVDLVKALSSLHTDSILHLVREVVKKPHQIKGDQKSTLVDIPMLQFTFAFIQGVSIQTLQENVAPLLNLLKESVQLNLAPRTLPAPGDPQRLCEQSSQSGQQEGHQRHSDVFTACCHDYGGDFQPKPTDWLMPSYFLVTAAENGSIVFASPPCLPGNVLQEVTQRTLEAVGGVAGSSLEQTSWLSRNLEVKAQPQVCPEEEPEDTDLYDSDAQASAMVSSSAPSVYSVQALTLLAEVLAPLLDVVYRSDEKEKAVPLISRLLYYVFPYLKNHSAYNAPSFCAGAQLLSSLSGYAYTKRAWKREAFELYMDPLFFHMDPACATHWRSIIDHLLTHEKTMFKDLMSMQSSSMKVLPHGEQKAVLLKRQAFAIFSGELDQYHLYLPLIQERLTETLRVGQTPSVVAQMFLTFRVLLLRISPQHLTSLWPIMVTELIRVFVRLEKALLEGRDVPKTQSKGGGLRAGQQRNGPVVFSQSDLDMYLSACKFLDTALSYPPDRMPLFQMYRWAFVPEVDVDQYSGPENSIMEEQECRPHIVRVMDGLRYRFGEQNGAGEEAVPERPEFPLLTLRSVSSIAQLGPFLQVLCCSFRGPASDPQPHPGPAAQYPAANGNAVLRKLEQITEGEFLESMDS